MTTYDELIEEIKKADTHVIEELLCILKEKSKLDKLGLQVSTGALARKVERDAAGIIKYQF